MIVARAFLEELLSSFSLPLPDVFKTSIVSLPNPDDTLPSNVSEEEVAYICAFVLCAAISIFSADLASAAFLDSGVAHLFDSRTPTTGESGNGWVMIETALVRLDRDYAPNASFPVWSVSPVTSGYNLSPLVGYDAVVCVKMYEPWIVQIYNSSLGVPTTMSVFGKAASTDFETDYGNRGPHLDSYTRVLSSAGKDSAYYVGYAGVFSFECC